MGASGIEPRMGEFWRADDPARQLPGTLSRVDGQWELALHGGLVVRGNDADGLALVQPTLIYGIAANRAYTLRHAYWRSGTVGPLVDDDGGGELDRTQRWVSYELIEDLHLPDDARLVSVSFELTGLGEFWPASGLTGAGFNRDTYTAPTPLEATWRGTSIVVKMALESHTRVRHRSATETPRVMVSDAAGFTLEQFQRDIEMPLRALLSVCLNHPVDTSNADVIVHDDHQPPPAARGPDDDSYEPPLPAGRLDPGLIGTAGRSRYVPANRPKLTADTLDFSTVVPAWLELAAQTLMPMGSALTRPDAPAPPLQNQVVAEVNAAETLHRALNPGEPDTSFAERIKTHLAEHPEKLNSKDRSRVVGALKHADEPNLERRLSALARNLGDQVGDWLLGGHLNDWAMVAATMRNALAHGFPTAHHVETDVGAMAGVHATVKAVTHLAMITHCGLPGGRRLAELISDDPRFRAVANQQLANWAILAARIREAS